MGYYISAKKEGMKASRPISIMNNAFLIERRIRMATVVSSLEDAKELLRAVKCFNPGVSLKIVYTNEYDGLPLETIKHLRGF